VQVNPEAVYELDLLQFEGLVAEGGTGRATAVGLYRGDFLAEFYLPDSAAFEEWTLARREENRRKVLDALEDLAGEAMTAGEYKKAAGYARRQIELDSLRESAYRQLIETLARDGRRAEALAALESMVKILQTELGLAPSPETELLAEQIKDNKLRGVDEVVTQIGVAEEPELPRHNLPSELTPFIGRDEELAQLHEFIGD